MELRSFASGFPTVSGVVYFVHKHMYNIYNYLSILSKHTYVYLLFCIQTSSYFLQKQIPFASNQHKVIMMGII